MSRSGRLGCPRDVQPDGRQEESEVDAVWVRHRWRCFDVAYRLLGSVGDAEDAVQDAYLRFLRADRDGIADPLGWLITVTSRVSIDHLRRHEHSRRAYVGPWLPEPLVTTGPDPVADHVTLDDSVRMALLVVLQELSPAERTAFVLHDVFALPYDEIGQLVGRSPQACRQLASRARNRVAASPATPRRTVDRREHEAVVRRFSRACEHGDLQALLDILAADVVGDFDSGGLIPGAPLAGLDGAEPVAAQLVASLSGRGASFHTADVNGEPGVIVTAQSRVVAVLALGVHQGRIDVIHAIGNPAKLAHLNAPPSATRWWP